VEAEAGEGMIEIREQAVARAAAAATVTRLLLSIQFTVPTIYGWIVKPISRGR
jgi:hypothetical protein